LKVVCDSHGVTTLATDHALLRAWLDEGADIAVPAAVLAECSTGTARDARVRRLLNGVDIIDIDGDHGLAAGALRHRARAGSGIDALVVAVADRFGVPVHILTSDPGDLEALAAHASHDLAVAAT
jgi:predicted nucleic acid-binding protein